MHILFKYKDNIVPGLVGGVELDQVSVVKLVHNLNLILHHLLSDKSH